MRSESTAHQPLLRNAFPSVDRKRIGISYSGGGSRVVLELGAAQGFINRGVVPDVIAGVSAGAITAMVHAIDPIRGRGLRLAAEMIPSRISSKALGLSLESAVQGVLQHRSKLQSLGDNAILKEVMREFFGAAIGDERPTLAYFSPPDHPRLLIAASDWISEDAFWFGPETPVEDALIASSAIPGVFPWRHHDSSAGHAVLIDGGVISNQPLSRLVLDGCGTIFACGFSTPAKVAPEPHNGLHNVLDAVQMLMHQCSHLEEDYVRLRLGGSGEIHRLHIDSDLHSGHYDFPPDVVARLMADAESQVSSQLETLGYALGGEAAGVG